MRVRNVGFYISKTVLYVFAQFIIHINQGIDLGW